MHAEAKTTAKRPTDSEVIQMGNMLLGGHLNQHVDILYSSSQKLTSKTHFSGDDDPATNCRAECLSAEITAQKGQNCSRWYLRSYDNA